MAISRPFATKRGKVAVAAALLAAAAGGWNAFIDTKTPPANPKITPVIVHQAVNKGITPPAVILAVDLIKKWEGLRLRAYVDMVGVVTVCYGETRYKGQPIKLGMVFTAAECEAMLLQRVTHDYFLPLIDKVNGMSMAPPSVQAALVSLGYNVGIRAAGNSSTARDITRNDYDQACVDLGKFVNAGGVFVQGLSNRRGMGDPGRAGEGEICKSGLAK